MLRFLDSDKLHVFPATIVQRVRAREVQPDNLGQRSSGLVKKK